MAEYKGVLHHFIKFKSLAPDAVKKCQSINDEAKNGQTIYLDKYNSKDFSNTINIIRTLGKLNYSKMNGNEHLNEKLNIVLKQSNLTKETHNQTLAYFSSRLNKKHN